jgi:DNA-binding CsgD family transcriptional regulator
MMHIGELNSAMPPSILDTIEVPIFVVEKDSHLRYANAAGEAMLSHGGPLRSVENVLTSDHLPDSQRLKSAIANSCAAGESQVVLMKDSGARQPPIAVIVPMRNGEAGQALVMLRQTAPSSVALVHSLRQLFRLSPAEAAIAIALATGADLHEIAEERSVKLNTLRSQIASIMAKTNTRRQAELVAMVARLESPV